MPRPLEIGLTEVTIPLNFYDQKSIKMAKEDIDPDGQNTMSRFICPYVASLLVNEIFKNGYILEWDNIVGLELVKNAGSPLSLFESERIINSLVNRGFFDKTFWEERRILTSSQIQKIWISEMKRLKRRTTQISPEYEIKNNTEQLA